MNQLPIHRRFALPLLAGVLLLSFSATASAISKVNLTVRSIPVTEKKETDKDKKKEPSKTDVDKRKLEATIRNGSREVIPGVSVQFYFIGKSTGETDFKVIDSDTKTQDLAAGESVKIESKVASATYTAAHTTKPKKDSNERSERVRASGDKFTGWAVQVFAAGEMLAEAYSSPVLKEVLSKEPAAAAPVK